MQLKGLLCKHEVLSSMEYAYRNLSTGEMQAEAALGPAGQLIKPNWYVLQSLGTKERDWMIPSSAFVLKFPSSAFVLKF